LADFSPTIELGRLYISSFWTHSDWTRDWRILTHFVTPSLIPVFRIDFNVKEHLLKAPIHTGMASISPSEWPTRRPWDPPNTVVRGTHPWEQRHLCAQYLWVREDPSADPFNRRAILRTFSASWQVGYLTSSLRNRAGQTEKSTRHACTHCVHPIGQNDDEMDVQNCIREDGHHITFVSQMAIPKKRDQKRGQNPPKIQPKRGVPNPA
jgi:hypothetical protein